VDGIEYSFGQITHLQGNSGQIEDGLFFYHANHLGSTQMVTDINADVTQQVLYAPFGEVITEYNAYWHQGKMPDYMFNAKELDEENGMYYYEARYYNPPTFISRDPLFEAKPWMNPYAYCSNSPIMRVDPSGLFDTESEAKTYKKEHKIRGKIKHDGDSWTIQNRRNKVSIFKDNSNTLMVGKDENGIVTSPLVSASAGRGGYRLINRGGVGHSDKTPKTNRDVSSIDITILWDWATELGRVLNEWVHKKENITQPISTNKEVEDNYGTEGYFGVKVRQSPPAPNYYEKDYYMGTKDSLAKRRKIMYDTNRTLDKVEVEKDYRRKK
jgi:RHS repeat-associated protein